MCPACKEEATSGDRAPEAPPVELPRLEEPPLTVSEVTIHDNGRVEALQKAKGKVEVARDGTLTTQPTIAEEERLVAGPSTQARPAPTIKQLEAALPYGLVAAIGVLGFWLILALIRHSWNQWAVFIMGIAVPWALTRGSTVRKKRASGSGRARPIPRGLACSRPG